MDIAAAVIRRDGEGEHRWFAGGGVFTMKATAADTGGAFMLFEDLVSSLDDASRPADFARLQAAARASPSITVLGPPPFRAFADADRAASKTAAQEA